MFQRVFDEGLAQSSYIIACARTGHAAVIDPRRDVDVYVAAARRHGLTIVRAIETHIHADFVSGARELAALGSDTIAGPGAGLAFPFHEAAHRERLQVGDTILTLLHTPGHTPEHICVLVEEPGAPVRILTGDTLFVGAVGRPDLLGEDASRALAGALFDSLHDTLLALGDEVEVHPGHGAGSACGAGIGAAPSSTIGDERRANPFLRHRSKEAFVAAVLADLPETPPYFARMKAVNQAGPQVLGLSTAVTAPPAIEARAAADAVVDGAVLLDLRDADAFGREHPAGAIHLEFGPKVGYWAGWVVPAGAAVILLAGNESQAAEARRQLLRVGLESVIGWIDGGLPAWRQAGLPVASVGRITVGELIARQGQHEPITIVDVRSRPEFVAGHIADAIHVALDEITPHAAQLEGETAVATICETGYRASLAASLLARAGIPNVASVAGGMAEYRMAAPPR